MLKPTRLFVIGLAALGFAVAGAFADEIIYFTNGTSMPVVSHTLEKDTIRVDLGNGSFIAFPLSLVEKVEAAGRDVYGGVSNKNRMVQGVVEANQDYPVQGRRPVEMQVADAETQIKPPDPSIERDDKGMAVQRTFPNPMGARNKVGVVGSQAVLGRKQPDGTRTVGNKSVIGNAFPNSKRPPLVGIQRSGEQPPPAGGDGAVPPPVVENGQEQDQQ